MNAALLLQILLVPWHQRDRTHPWVRRVIYTLALALAGGCVALIDGPWRWVIACMIGALVLAGAWMVLTNSLLEQNRPQAARLVPGHLLRVRQAALLAWGLGSLLPVAASTLLLDSPVPPALALLASSGLLTFMFWALRHAWLWWVLTLYLPLPRPAQLAWLWDGLADLWQANSLAVLALALLAQGVLMWRAFGNGDAAHQKRYASQVRFRQLQSLAAQGKQTGIVAWGGRGEWMARPFERIASAWLRHVTRRADAGQRSVMARAEIVLHGQQHWLRQLLSMSVVLGLVLAGFSIASLLLPGLPIWLQGSTGIGIAILGTGLSACFGLPGMLWHSRREQALLRLLPGMPLGPALNRAVAGRQLRQGLIAWALSALAMLVLAVNADNALLAWLPLAALPFTVLVLTRAPATMAPPNLWTLMMPLLGFMTAGSALFGIGALLQLSMWALLPASAVSLALSAALLAWRWRTLTAAPTALPAGRLA